MQSIEYGSHRNEILTLIFAQEVKAKLIWIAITQTGHRYHLLATLEATLSERERLGSVGDFGAQVAGNLLQHKVVVRVLLAHHHRGAFLDNTTLLSGNLR